MKNPIPSLSLAAIPVLGLLSSGLASLPGAIAADSLKVPLKDAKGSVVGEATLTQLAQGVRVRVEARSLPPGEHAMHFHGVGKCQAPDFKSAGDHFQPGKHQHGFDSAEGPHAGDLPNFVVAKNGTAEVEAVNPQVSLTDGPRSLRKAGGTALVIHAKADDYKSQPAGNAGDRLACGEIPAK